MKFHHMSHLMYPDVVASNSGQTNIKTPTRGVTASTLDYTVQFKTFDHPEGDNLNAKAYPVLPNAGAGVAGGGHVILLYIIIQTV